VRGIRGVGMGLGSHAITAEISYGPPSPDIQRDGECNYLSRYLFLMDDTYVVTPRL
jgi:hypothetical protein